jgi:hypothetical protein
LFKDIFGNAVNNCGASIEGWKYEWEGLWNVFENLDGNNLGHFVEHFGHQSLVETSYTWILLKGLEMGNISTCKESTSNNHWHH